MELPVYTVFSCAWTVEVYHSPRPRHGGRCTMTYILIVAGTALAFYAAAMFIIERENAAT
jgi:hypothetical protein